jgi:glutathione S-transferase
MWQLYQFPLCPFSRKVRLLLGEKGIAYDLVNEHPWERREGFREINPAIQTPVMHHAVRDITLSDSGAICEYFEETEPAKPLYSGSATLRAEIRRLTAWFDTKFYSEVGAPLLQEKMIKRLFYRQPPDATALQRAMRAVTPHMEMIGDMLDHHRWLTGTTLTMADLAAAAHLSVADYLGGIDWAGHDSVHDWYAALKSRPSFRPLLDERMGPLMPPAHYADVNF